MGTNGAQRIGWANWLRGPAALSVALGAHMVGAVWIGGPAIAGVIGLGADYAPEQSPPPWVEATLLIDWGAVGVAAFFLVSGLVVPRATLPLGRRGFLVGRLLRILPTFAAGTGIAGIVLTTNHAVTGAGASYSWEQLTVSLVPGLGTLMQIVPIPSIEWTLVVEMTFYSLVFVFHRRMVTTWWAGAAVTAGSIAVFWSASSLMSSNTVPAPLSGVALLLIQVTPYLPLVMIGVALTASERTSWPVWRLPMLVALSYGAYFYMASQPTLNAFQPSLQNRLTYLAMTVLFVLVWRIRPGRGTGRYSDFLSDISYSLYVTHFALGITLVLVGLELGLPPLVATAGSLGVVLIVSWIVSTVVERPTHQLSRRLARRLTAQQATPPGEPDDRRRPRITETGESSESEITPPRQATQQ